MGSKSKVVNTTPTDIGPLRQQLATWLMTPPQVQSGGPQASPMGGVTSPPPVGGTVSNIASQGGAGALGGFGGMNIPRPFAGVGNPVTGAQTAPNGGGGQPAATYNPAPPNPWAGISAQGQGAQGAPAGVGQFMSMGGGQETRSEGIRPGSLDPRAISANPAGYEQWRQQAAAAGYNYDSQGQPVTGPISNQDGSPAGGVPPWMRTGAPPMGPGWSGGAPGIAGPAGQQVQQQMAQQPGIANSAFDRIFAGMPPQMQAALVAQIQGPQNAQVAQTPGVGFQYDNTFNPTQQAQIQTDPRFSGIIDQLRGSMGGYQAPNAAAGQAGSVRGMVQSQDQLAQGPFIQQLLNPYKQMFAQSRDEALAAAKEQAGNLTGTGFANALGGATNRSLGEEQARLADILQRGGEFEVNRQMGLAGLENTRNISNAGFQTQASLANAGNALQAMGLAQQGQGQAADLLSRLGIAQGQISSDANLQDSRVRAAMGEQKNQLGFAGASQDSAQALQRALAQGQIDMNQFNLLAQLQAQRDSQQADLTQQANLFNAGQGTEISNANANRFLQLLLGLSTAGAGGQVQTSGGMGSLLGPLLQAGGAYLGSRKK